jgi:agmatine deiminase
MAAVTPAAQPAAGYRLPAEWEPHAATWLAWPHRRQTFLGDFADIPRAFVRLVRLLAGYEPVRVIGTGLVLDDAKASLQGIANVELVDIPTSDSWLRDTGPAFLTSAGGVPLRAVVFDFNAWGGKYPPWDADAAVAGHIAAHLGLDTVRPGIVLEGGAIETDGEGTLLVNHRCIDDPRRNPGLSRDELAAVLKQSLGIEQVLWVGGELAGDDTDGHIDQLARFVAPGRVVAARQPDRNDPNHEPLENNLTLLQTLVDARGHKLEVIPLDLPPRVGFAGVQLPASYLNFYLLNGAVIVPTFDHAADAAAVTTLATLFPGRTIEPFSALELIRGRGGVHCVTRDQPVG